MIGVAPTGALTAAGTDGVGEATTVVSEKNGAVTFDGASTSSAAITTGADTALDATISGDVGGVTTADGGTSSPVRTLLVVTSTMRKALVLALRDAPENLILVTITSIKQMLLIITWGKSVEQTCAFEEDGRLRNCLVVVLWTLFR
uniref:Uncharacterized protein n=1 Tax=Daphnia galeata TaxID=27404 RepID=A0A8J2SA46_9CRUS|nr:unnamed protein product [Daphnia galeata]